MNNKELNYYKRSDMSKPFDSPERNFMLVHNDVVDKILPLCSANEFKILMVIFRKTRGWSKDTDKISYSQMKEATGIGSDATIRKATKALEENGMIFIAPGEDGEPSTYMLNRNYDYYPLQNMKRPSLESEVTPLQKVKTQNTYLNKELNKKDTANAVVPTNRYENGELDILKSGAEIPEHEYTKGLRKRNRDIATSGMRANLENVLNNVNDYPVDVQEVIKAFANTWKILPPPNPSGKMSKWVKDARIIRKNIENSGLSVDNVFKEAYYAWKTPPEGSVTPRRFYEKFSVSDLGSINKLIWETISDILTGKKVRKTKTYIDANGNKIECDI